MNPQRISAMRSGRVDSPSEPMSGRKEPAKGSNDAHATGRGNLMGLKIYGIARSRAFRNLWAAGELGLKYEHVLTDFSDNATTSCRAPGFKAINPNAAVPVIDDDGFKLWESLAINLYLAKKHGEKGLYPKSAQDEAKAWQWALWTATSVEGPFGLWQSHALML